MATDNKIYDTYSNPYDKITLNWDGYLQLRDLHLSYLKNSNRILDLGAGTGNQTAPLVNEGKEVHSVDVNDAMTEFIMDKITHADPKLNVYSMNAENLNFSDKFFDAVTAMNVIYNFENPIKGMEEAYRVLLNKGYFLISGPLPGADIKEMIADCRKQLIEKQIYNDESEKNLQMMKEANDHLVANATLYTLKNLEKLLIDQIGFTKIVHATDEIYHGNAYFIAAKK